MESEQWERISCLNTGAPALHTRTHTMSNVNVNASAGWMATASWIQHPPQHVHIWQAEDVQQAEQQESIWIKPTFLSLAVNHNISPHLSLSTPRCTIHPRIPCFHYQRRDALLTRCLLGPNLFLKWPRPASHSHHTFDI